jgi:hypothetical protein
VFKALCSFRAKGFVFVRPMKTTASAILGALLLSATGDAAPELLWKFDARG